jgi:hypothetical protein
MPATINFDKGTFTVRNRPELRAYPETEWQHRLTTREHLTHLRNESSRLGKQVFDIRNSQWWHQQRIAGELCYVNEYKGGALIVRLKTAGGKFNLGHNEDGAFDRYLMDHPGEHVVYSLTSSNNGLESTHTFAATQAGIGSFAIVLAALVLTVNLAIGVAAAEAAVEAGIAVATIFGIEVTVFPEVGIVLAILCFIGLWLAYALGREIMLNLVYENRSKKTIKLVDHYFYNIGEHNPAGPVTLGPLQDVAGFEFYSDIVINVDNSSKFRGIGVSMVFQDENDSTLEICIRNDIYHFPYYTIGFWDGAVIPAYEAYSYCGGELRLEDFNWNNLIVKNRLDPSGFYQYTFAGILSFHDAE